MIKIKTNLTNYCISHDYISNLEKLDVKIIGSAGYNKKYPKNWLNDYKGKKNISRKNKHFGCFVCLSAKIMQNMRLRSRYIIFCYFTFFTNTHIHLCEVLVLKH